MIWTSERPEWKEAERSLGRVPSQGGWRWERVAGWRLELKRKVLEKISKEGGKGGQRPDVKRIIHQQ